ncbi:MAG: hypothetical protein ACK5EW_02200 [Bacteroidota bacterium]|jgi:hypothetical protein
MNFLRHVLFFGFFIWFTCSALGQYISGARMAALSGSAIASTDAAAGFHNFSSIANESHTSYMVYAQAPFGIMDIRDAGIGIFTKLGLGNAGLNYSNYGNSNFSRQQVKLGYAMKLSEKFNASMQIGLSNTRIAGGYGHASTVLSQVGMTYYVRKGWSWALNGCVPASLLLNEEDIPARIQLGTSYTFGKTFAMFASCTASSSAVERIHYSFGAEYIPHEQLFVRAGMNTFWQTWSFGIGTSFKSWKFDASAVIHPQLGTTPQIGLVYEAH